MKNLLILVSIFLLLLVSIDCQRGRGRARGRGRGKSKGNCHLKEIDECLKKVEKYSNNANSSTLLTTSRGIDEICSNSQEVVTCIKGFIKKCGTPLQRELFDFAIEQFSKSIDQFCKPGTLREEFLVQSPCINEKVIGNSGYKRKCVDGFLASIERTDKLEDFDDRLDTVCCSYTRWDECLFSSITEECGEPATEAMKSFLDKAFGGLSNLICTKKAFNPTSKRCKSLYASADTQPKGKLSDNPITKYLASYFGFLFN